MAKTIVIDQGSFSTKFGYNDATEPHIERSCVGKERRVFDIKKASNKAENKDGNGDPNPNNNAGKPGINGKRSIVNYGTHTINNIKNIKLKYFMKDNEIISFNGIENYYKNWLLTWLGINFDDISATNKLGNVLITQSFKNFYKTNKRLNKFTEILYENLNVSGLMYKEASILSLYGAGHVNGLVVDSGHSHTTIMPVIEGYKIPGYNGESIKYINLGGKHVDKYFQNLLRKSGINYFTGHEMEHVRSMKEKICELIRDSGYIKQVTDDDELNCIRYELPDHKILQIGSPRHRSGEILFSPYLMGLNSLGIHNEIIDSINNVELSLKQILYDNILLSGGNTLFKSFPERLVREINNYDYNIYDYNLKLKEYKNLYNKQMMNDLQNDNDELKTDNDSSNINNNNMDSNNNPNKPVMNYINNFIKKKTNKKTRLKIRAPKRRDILSWKGGAVLTSLDQFTNDLWITQPKYNEFGLSILYRNDF